MAPLPMTLSFLLLLTTLLPRTLSQSSPGGCNLSLNRLVGRSNSYVYACNCPLDGRLGPVARAEITISSSPPDNAAQAAATIRCILNDESRLLRICARNPRFYDSEATKTLQKCVKAPTTPEDRELKGKFTFSRERCEAGLSTFFGAQVAAVWLCLCREDGFDVVLGRSAFVTDASPLGGREEAEFLRLCTQPFLEAVDSVCKTSPEDFEILSLHFLQVCCKRARVSLEKDKFECAAIVPDDLSTFKVPI